MSRVERYQEPGWPVVELRYSTLQGGTEVMEML